MRVTVVGIGGAGCNFAQRFRATDIPGLSRLIFIDTDETSLARATSTTAVPGDISRTYLQIGTGLPAGGDMAYARAGILEKAETLQGVLDGSHLVLLVVGLGRGTGSGAMEIVVAEARKARAKVLVLATLPFSFEIPAPRNAAQVAAQLAELPDVQIVTFPNDEYSHHPEDSFDDIMDRVDSAILATASRLVTSLAG